MKLKLAKYSFLIMDPRNISIEDYSYILPESKIANYPLPERDQSKLLIWNKGEIKEDIYKNITDHLPEKSLLIFNNTKVIQARILFKKSTGGVIEIFCLEPYEQNNEYNSVMNKKEFVHWKCLIGGASKWKSGPLEKSFIINNKEVNLKAELTKKLPEAYITKLSWKPDEYSFGEIIEHAGEMPLPPYIKRKAIEEDRKSYQTIYAEQDGSVAAPTAGLHFTPGIFSSFKNKNILTDFITLHVGAGTFKPVKSKVMLSHEMHAEWIDVSMSVIKNILKNKEKIIAVGTTSLRTIESLYWMGLKVLSNINCVIGNLEIKQWGVYDKNFLETNVSVENALTALLNWMKLNQLTRIISKTQILILPGYKFKIAKGLITNFHQPKSTLLLLIAAAIGNEWKRIYNYALENNFRFLSYGDGCLLLFDN